MQTRENKASLNFCILTQVARLLFSTPIREAIGIEVKLVNFRHSNIDQTLQAFYKSLQYVLKKHLS